MIHSLLTWPAYGTWILGPAQGRIEDCALSDFALPEPDPGLTLRRRVGLKWPVTCLSVDQQTIVKRDIQRMQEFRPFRAIQSVITADHVHLLLEVRDEGSSETDLHRLIQLVKGATSRALSAGTGNGPAYSTSGDVLPHRKWWSRQYVAQRLHGADALAAACALLAAHRYPAFTA